MFQACQTFHIPFATKSFATDLFVFFLYQAILRPVSRLDAGKMRTFAHVTSVFFQFAK